MGLYPRLSSCTITKKKNLPPAPPARGRGEDASRPFSSFENKARRTLTGVYRAPTMSQFELPDPGGVRCVTPLASMLVWPCALPD